MAAGSTSATSNIDKTLVIIIGVIVAAVVIIAIIATVVVMSRRARRANTISFETAPAGVTVDRAFSVRTAKKEPVYDVANGSVLSQHTNPSVLESPSIRYVRADAFDEVQTSRLDQQEETFM